MHSTDTKSQFIELRAKGWSLARIAARLDVCLRTLVEWNRQSQAEIRALRAVELEALQEKILATHEQELTRLTHHLPMNRSLVGTPRCDVSACEAACGTVAPLDAAPTAQRAVSTNTNSLWRRCASRGCRQRRSSAGWVFALFLPRFCAMIGDCRFRPCPPSQRHAAVPAIILRSSRSRYMASQFQSCRRRREEYLKSLKNEPHDLRSLVHFSILESAICKNSNFTKPSLVKFELTGTNMNNQFSHRWFRKYDHLKCYQNNFIFGKVW